MASMTMKLRAQTLGRPQAASRKASVRVCANSRVDAFSKNDIIVSPSILSADFSRLGDEVRNVGCRSGDSPSPRSSH